MGHGTSTSGASPTLSRGSAWLVAVTALFVGACKKESEAPSAEPSAAPPIATVSETPVDAPPEAGATIPADMSVADLLAAARQALTEERVVRPAGNSALEYYLAVLAKEPNNPTAAQAVVDIYPMVVAVAEREIAARRLDEADRIIALLDRASPNSFSVRSLRERIATVREAEARALLAQQQELERQRFAAEQARQQVTSPAPSEASPTPIAEVTAPTEPEPEPPPTPEPVRPAITETQPIAAAPAPASPPVVAAPPPPPAARIGETRPARPLRQVEPRYPPDAARRRQEGWVELTFTIGADGRVSDVQVVRSKPPRIFDREAISAMQQWTFEPALRDGQPVPSRGARRMEFKL